MTALGCQAGELSSLVAQSLEGGVCWRWTEKMACWLVKFYTFIGLGGCQRGKGEGGLRCKKSGLVLTVMPLPDRGCLADGFLLGGVFERVMLFVVT